MPPPKVFIVLPTYNERENVRRLLPVLFALEIPRLELLVVDDNSPDGTGRIVEEWAAAAGLRGRVHVLHRPQKQGLGPAYIAGFRLALDMGAGLLLQMDADFSHQPQYVPQLLALTSEYDVVVGSRFVPGGSVDESWSPLRKLLSWWANRVYTPAILGLPVKDATGGFRVWQRATLEGMGLERVKANGYVFQVEMITLAHRLGYRISETPIHFPDRQYGDSKMSGIVAIEASLRLWQIALRYRHISPRDRRKAPVPAYPMGSDLT